MSTTLIIIILLIVLLGGFSVSPYGANYGWHSGGLGLVLLVLLILAIMGRI